MPDFRSLFIEFSNNTEIINSKDVRRKSLLCMLRFLPFKEVDIFIKNYVRENPNHKSLILDSYDAVKIEFLAAAPYCSRYSDPSSLSMIDEAYHRRYAHSNIETTAVNDVLYGNKRAMLADSIVEKLIDPETFVDKIEHITEQLPLSSTSTRRVAKVVGMISNSLFEDMKKNLFKQIRTIGGRTNIIGRYAWGSSLIKSVFKYSILPEIRRMRNKHGNPNNIIDEHGNVKVMFDYYLTYENLKKETTTSQVFFSQGHEFYHECWFHGQAPINDTWPDIEDLFEDIWSMNLSSSDEENQKAQAEKLKEFYTKVCKLIWLIGNTQPLQRGSGSIAEIMLAIVHKHHKLQPPILKLEFPQLDVLDISFPLADYQYLFPYFFEPSTIHPSLIEGSDELEGLNCAEQLDILYKRLNASEERRELQVIASNEVKAFIRKEEDVKWMTSTVSNIQTILEKELNDFLARRNINYKKDLNADDLNRYLVVENLLNKLITVKEGVITFREEHPDNCIISFRAVLQSYITEALTNKYIEKYSNFYKVLITIANSILWVFNYSKSSASFFSVEGKPKDALLYVEQYIEQIQIAK
ncbi:MAG: hypothetical protein P1U74_03815 [Legionellaceae bacterium]|nr:hypothetical protein [Legionellaceae bacterium]